MAHTAQPAGPAIPPTPTLVVVHLPALDFQVTSVLADIRPRVVDFSGPDASYKFFAPNELQESATNPPVPYIAFNIDDRVITVHAELANTGVTNREIFNAVQKWLTGELIRGVGAVSLVNFGNPSVRYTWHGLGQPDAEGVCTFRLSPAPAP